jgi:hypothetical protein
MARTTSLVTASAETMVAIPRDHKQVRGIARQAIDGRDNHHVAVTHNRHEF